MPLSIRLKSIGVRGGSHRHDSPSVLCFVSIHISSPILIIFIFRPVRLLFPHVLSPFLPTLSISRSLASRSRSLLPFPNLQFSFLVPSRPLQLGRFDCPRSSISAPLNPQPRDRQVPIKHLFSFEVLKRSLPVSFPSTFPPGLGLVRTVHSCIHDKVSMDNANIGSRIKVSIASGI